MNDPFLVRRLNGVDDLAGDAQRLVNSQPRALRRVELLGERLAIHELEDDVRDASPRIAPLLEAKDLGDVWMIERGQQLRLAREARSALRISDEGVGQDFDGDVAIELGIASAIHLAHSASPKRAEDLVRTEPHSGGQGHRDS
jgi:hypothetical protein